MNTHQHSASFKIKPFSFLNTSDLSILDQGSHRIMKSGKGRDFQKCIFQAWKGMEFSAWVGKNNEIKDIII